jgi:hypothetical protein
LHARFSVFAHCFRFSALPGVVLPIVFPDPPHCPPDLRVGGLFVGLVGSLMNRHFEVRVIDLSARGVDPGWGVS